MNETSSLKEPLFAFALALVILFAATVLASLWSFLHTNLLAVAAITFFGIPYVILRRKKADFHHFGIALERIPPREVLFGLLIALLVLPFFLLGNHLWEKEVQNRQVSVQLSNYLQWDTALEAPVLQTSDPLFVQVRTQGGDLFIEARSAAEPLRFTLRSDRPLRIRSSGMRIEPIREGDEELPRRWEISLPSQGEGRIQLRRADFLEEGPPNLLLDLSQHSESLALYLGRSQKRAEQQKISGNYWWILLWSLTHLLLIALPEEYFYRGYLQTRLGDAFKARGFREKFLGLHLSNWVTSALFALGHFFIPIGGAFLASRLTVFFPSLLFGWMRARTGSIVAPVVFHGLANMMVLLAGVHYF